MRVWRSLNITLVHTIIYDMGGGDVITLKYTPCIRHWLIGRYPLFTFGRRPLGEVSLYTYTYWESTVNIINIIYNHINILYKNVNKRPIQIFIVGPHYYHVFNIYGYTQWNYSAVAGNHGEIWKRELNLFMSRGGLLKSIFKFTSWARLLLSNIYLQRYLKIRFIARRGGHIFYI